MRRKSITSEMMKSYIADALLLLMENKAFQDITVSEIVKKAGVNRSTYYRHFETKEDVIIYYLDNLSLELIEWEKRQKLDFKQHLIRMYEHYYNHKKQMMTIYKSGQAQLLLEVLKKYLVSDRHTDKTTKDQYSIAFHIGGTFNQFLLWFSRNMEDSPADMAKYTLSLVPDTYIRHIWNPKERWI